MVSPPTSPRGTRPPVSPRGTGARPASPRGTRTGAAPASPRSPRPSAGSEPAAKPRPSAGASARRPGAKGPPLPPGARPPLPPSPGAGGEDALKEQNPPKEGSNPGTPSKADTPGGSKEGTPKAKRSVAAASRVRVFVRVRPAVRANERVESEGGASSAIHCQSPKLWLLEQKDESTDKKAGGTGPSPRQFVFDGALPPDTTQEGVYQAACDETDVISGVLEGVNGCVMCYGQTGAGKTHTLGNFAAGSEGIVSRALSAILEAPGEGREIRLSYVQIYLEAIYDLLSPESHVDLREVRARP